jgi:hypothetical protein
MPDSITSSISTELLTEFSVSDELLDCSVKRIRLFSRNDEAAGHAGSIARHHPSDLRSQISSGEDRAAAREHAGELGRHHQVGRTRSLRKQMDVGGVEQVIETLEWLERKQGDI